ncbi:MAG TPA: VacB/RNase II family 3'-5' exoribonuclease [Gaiellaceae bacterium]|nr:VacB/RNase II family 3'-5' exoribonuclease [Gaiellaceae bacterium]
MPGTPITIDRKGLGEAEVGDLVEVTQGRGRARVERVIGPAKAIATVLEALLVEQGLREGFEPHDLPTPSFEGRTDLRDLHTFTIDPETAKDFDDAISVRAEGEGLRVWVHIADVSYFVPAGSPLDRGAAERANSVYVPGLVAPMLPHSLADEACSLRPNEDRLTVTVEIPFSAGLEPGEPLFYRSVIRSNERLTYSQAEQILAGGKADPETVAGLRLTDRISSELRRRRFARGALRIESREINFAFDGQGGVERAWLESEPKAHSLIEELMILANEAVAEFLSSRRRESLYRVHEPPEPQAVELMLAKLTDLEVPTLPVPKRESMSPADAARLAAAASERVTEYVRKSKRGAEAFPALVLRSLKQAHYDPRNLGHSGLASTAYTHFTSPIRRYPDLVVHRALLRELGQGDDPVPKDLGALADHTSEQERAATEIEYQADDICAAWLLERTLFDRGWEDPFPGEITGVIPSGLFVRFGEVFEGYLPARRLQGDYYELNDLGTALVGRRGGRRYRLGDEIEVKVEDIRRSEGKVEVSSPGSGESRGGAQRGRRSRRRPRSRAR